MGRIKIGDTTIYEGPIAAVPRKGDDIHHDGEVVRVESVTWQFDTDKGEMTVTLTVGDQSYSF